MERKVIQQLEISADHWMAQALKLSEERNVERQGRMFAEEQYWKTKQELDEATHKIQELEQKIQWLLKLFSDQNSGPPLLPN